LDQKKIIYNHQLTRSGTSNNSEKIIRIGSGKRVFFEQKVDGNNKKLLIAKADSSPSTTSNRGARPNNFPSSTKTSSAPYLNPYRIPPKLNFAINPAGDPDGGSRPGDDDNPDEFNKADQSKKSTICNN
jgi:hypothetical protein